VGHAGGGRVGRTGTAAKRRGRSATRPHAAARRPLRCGQENPFMSARAAWAHRWNMYLSGVVSRCSSMWWKACFWGGGEEGWETGGNAAEAELESRSRRRWANPSPTAAAAPTAAPAARPCAPSPAPRTPAAGWGGATPGCRCRPSAHPSSPRGGGGGGRAGLPLSRSVAAAAGFRIVSQSTGCSRTGQGPLESRTLMSVDLPTPLAPTTATRLDRRHITCTSDSVGAGLPRYVNETLSSWRGGSGRAAAAAAAAAAGV
jgi:hypothetical protein